MAKAEQAGKDVSLDAIARCLLAAGAEVKFTFGKPTKKKAAPAKVAKKLARPKTAV